MSSFAPVTQADISAFLTTLAPVSLARSVLEEYYVPLGFAGIVAVLRVRGHFRNTAGALESLPLMLWSLCFCLGTLAAFDGGSRLWSVDFARLGLVSFLALVPILVVAGMSRPAGVEPRGWRLAVWISMATAMCDWTFALLCVMPLPHV